MKKKHIIAIIIISVLGTIITIATFQYFITTYRMKRIAGVIGSADGPTSILLTSNYNFPLYVIILMIIIIIVLLYLLLRRRK